MWFLFSSIRTSFIGRSRMKFASFCVSRNRIVSQFLPLYTWKVCSFPMLCLRPAGKQGSLFSVVSWEWRRAQLKHWNWTDFQQTAKSPNWTSVQAIPFGLMTPRLMKPGDQKTQQPQPQPLQKILSTFTSTWLPLVPTLQELLYLLLSILWIRSEVIQQKTGTEILLLMVQKS